MYSKDVELYRKNLVKITNSSNLTIGCAYYVAKDFLHELRAAYLQDLQKNLIEDTKPMEAVESIETLVTTPPTEHSDIIETHELIAAAEQADLT